MQQRNHHLAASQILALSVTAVEIVPSPGSGRILIPIAIVGKLTFGTVAYTAGGTVRVAIGNPANFITAPAFAPGFIQSAANTVAETEFGTNWTLFAAAANWENQPINLYNDTGPFLNGDGTLDLTIFYGTSKLP